ncbi:tyrosinase family protein [Streptomyces sp. ISL-22]|uniref:tyrosinase family protein n=1 Tax=unclassified Streptomyces TaxID=2593676 RepID=UPI001BEBE73F|nr:MULTISPECIES: tyrosinase family protein [unclassified Streptomyces]MBT2418483.1 tyrosinase family protein [Streptomyces sp. ISL-24]MBT2437482.1 tyrosinase family protein [Streptomyces sp. ISL-22]
MAVVRKNILTDATARDDYVRGVGLLKREPSGHTTAELGIPGPTNPVSTYDLFVVWHIRAMMKPVPPTGDHRVRNAAHRGPIFLPWHRVMLAALEANLQRALQKPQFALPYWDWAADGELGAPAGAKIWKDTYMGGQGAPVADGPFRYDPADPDTFTIRLRSDSNGKILQAERGLRRIFGQGPPIGSPTMPTSTEQKEALAFDPGTADPVDRYDSSPFHVSSEGFRSRLEGFAPRNNKPHLHNQVHMWVGGDMGPAHSPNDPVFFLHHCNVDRIWEGWMDRYGRLYAPDMSFPAAVYEGHRIDDPIVSPLGPSATPRKVMDMSTFYVYDVKP